MRVPAMNILDLSAQDTLEMPLAQQPYMRQTFAMGTAGEPLHIRILPR
jgi:hypothetical protein